MVLEDHPAARVSVLITQFHPRGFLREAVQSVLDQRAESPVELIVVLAAPDPASEAWLGTVAQVDRVLRTDEPRIGAMLRNGLEQAHGELVCFLDDDDRFRAGKLAAVDSIFRSEPDLEFYHHQIDLIDDGGRPVVNSGFRRRQRERMPPTSAIILGGADKLRRLGSLAPAGPDFNLSSVCVRRSALLPFLDALGEVTAGPDAFIFFAAGLLSRGAIRCDGARWTEYRLHASSVSRAGSTGDGDPRPALQAASLLQARAQRAVVLLAERAGDARLVDLARGYVACHQFFAELRSPRPTRSGWMRSWWGLLPHWRTIPFRANWPAIFGSLGWLASPERTQRAYLRAIA